MTVIRNLYQEDQRMHIQGKDIYSTQDIYRKPLHQFLSLKEHNKK